MRTLLLSTGLLLMAGFAVAEDVAHTSVIKPDTLVWKDNAAFPKGVQIATLVGDPNKSGDTQWFCVSSSRPTFRCRLTLTRIRRL
jgi:hypothetical protein